MEKTMKSKLVDYLLKGAFSAALFFCASPEKADAGLIKLLVEGHVSNISTADNLDFDGSVEVGIPMTGYCIYDSDTPNLMRFGDGLYELEEIKLSFGNYNFTHRSGSSEDKRLYIHTRPATGYFAYSYDPYSDDIFYLNGEEKNFKDFNWNNFGMRTLYLQGNEYKTLPETLPIDYFPPLEGFYSRAMSIEHDSGPYFNVTGYIDSVSLIHIPEPSTMALFGLGGLALIRRHRE